MGHPSMGIVDMISLTAGHTRPWENLAMASRRNGYQSWGVPERIATWAASTGFAVSALLMISYRDAANSAWGLFDLRAPIQAAFVFLWPSSLLLRGAHTAEGSAILFLFSAALNAGYYVFVSLAAFLLHGKLESIFPAAHGNVAAVRVYRAPKLVRRAKISNGLD
jgi:hypothetical protein